MIPESLNIGRNRQLFEDCERSGRQYVRRNGIGFFVNEDGSYFGFPIGFITGPYFNNNGSPRPFYVSINSESGWIQYTAPTSAELREKAIQKQREILGE